MKNPNVIARKARDEGLILVPDYCEECGQVKKLEMHQS